MDGVAPPTSATAFSLLWALSLGLQGLVADVIKHLKSGRKFEAWNGFPSLMYGLSEQLGVVTFVVTFVFVHGVDAALDSLPNIEV